MHRVSKAAVQCSCSTFCMMQIHMQALRIGVSKCANVCTCCGRRCGPCCVHGSLQRQGQGLSPAVRSKLGEAAECASGMPCVATSNSTLLCWYTRPVHYASIRLKHSLGQLPGALEQPMSRAHSKLHQKCKIQCSANLELVTPMYTAFSRHSAKLGAAQCPP